MLFESILIYQNNPVSASLPQRASRLGIEKVRMIERTHYPLTVTVIPGAELLLRIGYDVRWFEPAAIARMLVHIGTLLQEITTKANRPLAELVLVSEVEQEQLLRHGNDAHVGLQFDLDGGIPPSPLDLEQVPAEILDSWIEDLQQSLERDPQ